MPHDLEKWRDVADANGGLDLTTMKPSEADTLVTALRHTAERELPRLADTDPASEDGSYRIGLLKLLEVTWYFKRLKD